MDISDKRLSYLKDNPLTLNSKGDRLKFIRNWYGLSRTQFADLLGTTPAVIKELEQNERRFSFGLIDKMERFGWPRSWILSGKLDQTQKIRTRELSESQLKYLQKQLEYLKEHENGLDSCGDRIRFVRTWYEMSRSEFAKLLGVGSTTIYNFDNNIRQPDAKVLDKLKELGWPSDWILFGKANQTQKTEMQGTLDDKVYIHQKKIAAQVNAITSVPLLVLIEKIIEDISGTVDQIKKEDTKNQVDSNQNEGSN